ncbi:MAG: hypothetical protein KA715_03905 [Xanthomonadaceae bacterium]|nr:hypothetical protein [Xanthomonadaceae bacterium]
MMDRSSELDYQTSSTPLTIHLDDELVFTTQFYEAKDRDWKYRLTYEPGRTDNHSSLKVTPKYALADGSTWESVKPYLTSSFAFYPNQRVRIIPVLLSGPVEAIDFKFDKIINP